ncbi:MAG TPA: hypothetical protein VFJ48_12895 [Casimicrobiaceae bacterium]|nr:hypothetical protein [Casimicrobiaceae bacterium]
MPQSFARADRVPAQLVRRLVLGIALGLGLAFALAPRTAAVHAQEPKAAAPAAKSPSTGKSLTITDGQAKIELKEGNAAKGSATPGDSTDDEESTPAGKSGRRVLIDKRGHVQIQGFGDKEFDSVGDFVQNEPELAGMVVAIVAVVFLAPVFVVALVLWYRMRKARMLNETMIRLAEKGVITSSDALEALAGSKRAAAAVTAAAAVAPLQEQARQLRRSAAWSDLRKGVFTAGVGVALSLYSLFDDGSPNGLGLVLIFVGAGFLVLWWFEERQLAPPGAVASGTGTPTGTSGTTSGGSPPPA